MRRPTRQQKGSTSREKEQISKKIPSVGDTIQLSSGAHAKVTKLTRKKKQITHVYFKQTGMPVECISVNDEYKVLTKPKESVKNNSPPQGIERHTSTHSESSENSQTGQRGRKHFDQTGWLTGTVQSATVSNDDSNRVTYLVQFSDGSTGFLDDEELANFKYELENPNDIPPSVRPFIVRKSAADSTIKSPENASISIVESPSANNGTPTSGVDSTSTNTEKAPIIAFESPRAISGPSSSNGAYPQENCNSDAASETTKNPDLPACLAKIHEMLISAISPTNDLWKGEQDILKITCSSARESTLRVCSTGAIQKVPLFWPFDSGSIKVVKDDFSTPNAKFQSELQRTKEISIDLFQGVFYSTSRRRISRETPRYLSGETYHIFSSNSQKPVMFTILFAFEFTKRTGFIPTELLCPMQVLGFTWGPGGDIIDQLIVLSTNALMKNSQITDCEMVSILGVTQEKFVAITEKAVNVAKMWVNRPTFTSDSWKRVNRRVPHPGVSVIPEHDTTTETDTPKEKKPTHKRPSRAEDSESAKKLTAISEKNRLLKEENKMLKNQAASTRSQKSNEIVHVNPSTISNMTPSPLFKSRAEYQSAQEDQSAKERAELELKLVIEHSNAMLTLERAHFGERTELLERIIRFQDSSQKSQCTQMQATTSIVQSMANQNTANMLKVQIASNGPTQETNNLIGTAVQNHFFSTTSPSRSSIQEHRGGQHLIGTDHETQRHLLLEGPQEVGTSRSVDKGRIRDNIKIRIRELEETVESLEDELKVKVETEIFRLKGEVRAINNEIASALC